ncbi:hypothetical protein ACHAXR_004479 [Thalassiosira sp. AJA248-18]
MMLSKTPQLEETRKKRTRPGRSSRRRKRKANAILEAAAAAAASSLQSSSSPSAGGDDGTECGSGQRRDDGNNTSTATTAVPSDRGYTLEGVKVRRREERKKRRLLHHHHHRLTEQHDEKGDDDAQLDPTEERALRSQLGFIPGNAICVAARLSNELLDAMMMFQNHSSSSSSSYNKKKEGGSNAPRMEGNDTNMNMEENNSNHNEDCYYLNTPPSVVKLYPMVVRESYHGGKSDGRAFKGRRRGAMRVEDGKKHGDDEGLVESKKKGHNNDDECDAKISMSERKCRKERAWLVDESSSSTTTKPDQANNERNIPDHEASTTSSSREEASNQQKEHDQQQSKQKIIEPFPTLYWLTSPLLRTQISKLEISKTNNVPAMEERLRSSPAHLQQMERAHKSYGRTRWELLTPLDQANITTRGWKGALDESRGVAGIRVRGKNDRYDCVKCLHAHAAHYLAQVAEWEEEEMEKKKMEQKKEEDTMMVRTRQRDDLNLVGKWTMEAVFDSLSIQFGNKDSA